VFIVFLSKKQIKLAFKVKIISDLFKNF
jgi:hypothetical protein